MSYRTLSGSRSWGRFAATPARATTSIEADLAFFADPDGAKANLVDGAIGEPPRPARDKDRAFAAALIRERLVEPEVLLSRIGDLPPADVRVIARLEAWVRREAYLYR